MKKIVQTAQSIRFALLAGAKLKRSPMGLTRLGPTSSSAGAFADIGIEAKTVDPIINNSAWRTVCTIFSWAKLRMRRMTPQSTRI